MSANNSPVPSSEQVFAEAFAAAMPEESTPVETTESNENLQDPSIDVSGQDLVSEDEEVDTDISDTETAEEQTSDESDDNSLSDVEEIAVKGKDGKRKNIKVDFSDRNKLKKYIQKAANAVRLQSERDSLQAQVEKLSETADVVANLQSIVDSSGYEGLIDHLNADNGGFAKWFEGKVNRHSLRQHASEDELARYDAEDKAADLERRIALFERQQAEREERLAAESKQASMDRLAADVNPIYFKYTFDGKLGDSVAEQRHNKAMFREVTSTLDELSEEGVKITPAIIEREFRAYAQPFLKGVNKRVRQNTTKSIQQKKQKTAAHAQQQVRKGYSSDSMEDIMSRSDWARQLGNLWGAGKLKR